MISQFYSRPRWLLYGTGLRLLEGRLLRTKDVVLANGQIVARSGNHDQDRVTMLPATLMTRLKPHLHTDRELRASVM